VSANLDLVRSIYVDWQRGDYSSTRGAHREITFVFGDGPDTASSIGVGAMTQRWREQLRPWQDLTVESADYRELDDERILVISRVRARGATAGVEVNSESACVFRVRDGKVTQLDLYWDRERALTDLGLEE
jgi:ketosteroid isomerase-like protein